MFFSNVAILSLLPLAFAKNIQVLVGQNNSIIFSPNTVRATIGDTVEFLFLGGVSWLIHFINSVFEANQYFRTIPSLPALLYSAASQTVALTLALSLLPLHPPRLARLLLLP